MLQEHLLALTYVPLAGSVNDEVSTAAGLWSVLLSSICDDISSNLESNCSNRLSTYYVCQNELLTTKGQTGTHKRGEFMWTGDISRNSCRWFCLFSRWSRGPFLVVLSKFRWRRDIQRQS